MFDRRTFILAGASSFTHIGAPPALPSTSKTLGDILIQTGVPALGYAVVGPNGLIGLEAAGRRRLGVEDFVTTDDLWHIGSNTKAMTAALYARLTERGAGQWGATIPTLFPDLKLDPAWKTVRIEDLLAHRSGVSDQGVIDAGYLIKAHADTRPVTVQRTELAQRVFKAPPAVKSGSFEYANANYIIAGAAIERIVKTDWETAMAVEVFGPLRMASAAFGAPTGPNPWGHEAGAGNTLTPVEPGAVSDNPPVFGPAGRVHLSLTDYAKFARVFLAGGAGWINTSSLAKLAKPWDGAQTGYALGWELYDYRAWAEGPVLAHEGSNTLWRAAAFIGPAKPLALLLVTNAGGEAGQHAVQLMAARLIAQQSGEDAPPPG